MTRPLVTDHPEGATDVDLNGATLGHGIGASEGAIFSLLSAPSQPLSFEVRTYRAGSGSRCRTALDGSQSEAIQR